MELDRKHRTELAVLLIPVQILVHGQLHTAFEHPLRVGREQNRRPQPDGVSANVRQSRAPKFAVELKLDIHLQQRDQIPFGVFALPGAKTDRGVDEQPITGIEIAALGSQSVADGEELIPTTGLVAVADPKEEVGGSGAAPVRHRHHRSEL